jgi:hypothetical protein
MPISYLKLYKTWIKPVARCSDTSTWDEREKRLKNKKCWEELIAYFPVATY